jgi:hypothetical protein
MKNEIPAVGCAHQAGTRRFDMDPVTSASKTGAMNPALTAIANALRPGGHRLPRLA